MCSFETDSPDCWSIDKVRAGVSLVLPALDVLLQRHHHGEMLLHVWLPSRLALSPQRIVHQLEVALPRENVGVAVVEAQRDLGPSVGAAVAANHSDLTGTEREREANS